MKTKITLVIQIILLVMLVACGGVEAVGNNDGSYVDDSYSERVDLPPATPVQMSSAVNIEHPATEQEINGYVDTRYDQLSTFGIDVDTASYTRARDYIESGSLPPAESVRVEEFINYFDAGYPTPEDIAFGIYADGALSPFHSPGTYILRFGIQGYQVPEVLRKPVSLTFVIDVSGSMSDPNKLDLVQRSLRLLVERLRPDDSVSIIVYGSNARVVLEPTSGANQSVINSEIDRLSSGGTTYAEAGLRLGYNMALQAFISGGVNRVILASDGVANVGKTEASELLKFIRDYADMGITLTSMGFGMGTFNDPFMEELADNGDGNYAYIDDLDEAKRLFVDELTSTLQVIAKDARIQVDFNPKAVSYYRLLGYENRDIADEDFRNDTVDAGEIGAGHSVTALYAVQMFPNAQGRIATVQLRWEDPDTHQNFEINGNFNTWDLLRDFQDADAHYQLAVLAAQFAELLKESPYGSETTINQLLDYAYPLVSELHEDPDVIGFVSLLQQAKWLIH